MTDMPAQIIASIHAYFAGERSEQSLLLGYCTLLLAAAAALWSRGELFARGLAVGLLLTALLGSSASVPLLIRDKANVVRLTARPERAALLVERERIAKVVSNYPLYRYAYAVIVAIALAGLLWRPSDLLSGFCAGLLVLALTGFVVDHYSEARAKRYAAALARCRARKRCSARARRESSY